MTPTAIILMVIAILMVWGGLVAAIVALRTIEAPDVQLDERGNVIDDASLDIGAW